MSRGYTPQTAPDHDLKGWPGGIKYIIGNEGCERFSYYGMRAILYMYIVGLYVSLSGMSEDSAKLAATETYHTFSAGVYALPMIGALIADRLLGKYRTILWLSLVYCAGHVVLAIGEGTMEGLIWGLVLIAIGSGGIKPCVSAHVGDQFGRGNWHLIQKVYNAFYFIINFGSAFATLIIPMIRGDMGVMSASGQCMPLGPNEALSGTVCYTNSVSWAFAVPGILMGLATFFFWLGRKKFIHVPPTHPPKLAILDVASLSALFMAFFGWWAFLMPVWNENFQATGGFLVSGWFHLLVSALFFLLFLVVFVSRQRIKQDDGPLVVLLASLFPSLFGAERDPKATGFFASATKRFGADAVDGTQAMLRIIGIFALVSVFWALFDQHSSTWIAQAKDMDRVFELSSMGWIWLGLGGGVIIGSALFLSQPKGDTNGFTPMLYGMVVAALVGSAFFYLVDFSGSAGDWLLFTAAIGVSWGIGHVLSKSIPKGIARSGIFWLWVGAGALAGSLGEGAFEVQPSQVPATNPFMVMILIPFTTFGLYPLMDKIGFKPTPLRRMTIGMIMASVSFVAVALIQVAMNDAKASGDTVHVIWQFIPYLIITLSEVMVSITGLEFGYSQAPKHLKSVVMGFWLLCVALGNKLVALLAGFGDMELDEFFWLFAGLMAAAGVLFGIIASFYTYQDRTQ